jgi:hypothetical protein
MAKRMKVGERELVAQDAQQQSKDLLFFKKKIAWHTLAIPSDIFQGLGASGGNCNLQRLLEEVNEAEIECTCHMCTDMMGSNYPGYGSDGCPGCQQLPEDLPKCMDGFRLLAIAVEDCKLFGYFHGKAKRYNITLGEPILEWAPDSITLVSRLATGRWLSDIYRRPYDQQLDFFKLIYDIEQDAFHSQEHSFERWFSFCGRSLLP